MEKESINLEEQKDRYSHPSCYLPEENNPYPLCIGRGLDRCKDCGLWRDQMPSWIDDGKNW